MEKYHKDMAIANEPPDDVLIDILSRLPARSILRFKSVSKHWYSMVQNPIFISLHRAHARLFHCVSLERTVDNDPWCMYLLPDQTSIYDLDLSFTRPHLNKDFSHQGSCNGLMCLSFNSNIVICNPATREYRLLPQPPCHTWHTDYLGFAFDYKTNDYKVVRVATPCKTLCLVDHRTHIYCMSADSWKELVVVARNHNLTGYHHHPCTSLDGVFYWLSSNVYPHGSTIDALNTAEGSFERRSLPSSIGSHSWTNLCLLNNSIALVVPSYDHQLGERQFDVWLMDKYGVQDCWTKKYTIGPILGSQHPFGFQPNNEVLMTGCNNGLIVSYNQSTRDIKVYKQLCNWPKLRCSTQVFQYSESLVSVKRQLD